MPDSENRQFASPHIAGAVRVLPVANLVMFPHVMQPLRLCQRRDCELLEDALRGDRLIALAVLAPGWEKQYDGHPPLGPFACLGKVVVARLLEDGSQNLLLTGLRRVRLVDEIASRKSYREARAVVCEDVYPANQAEQGDVLKRAICRRLSDLLPRSPRAHEQLEQLANTRVSLGVLTDVLAYALGLGRVDKEALLSEVHVRRRAELLLARLEAGEGGLGADASDSSCFPPGFSSN